MTLFELRRRVSRAREAAESMQRRVARNPAWLVLVPEMQRHALDLARIENDLVLEPPGPIEGTAKVARK